MAVDFTTLQRLGIGDVMLWMLTFAIIYGVLSQAKIPEQKPIRAIIAMVVGFFVILAAPSTFIATLANLSTGLLVAVLVLLVALIFIEVGGLKHFEKYAFGEKDKEGNLNVRDVKHKKIGERNPYLVVIILLIFALLIFLAAGGAQFLGFKSLPQFDVLGAVFLIVIILAVIWMIRGREEK